MRVSCSICGGLRTPDVTGDSTVESFLTEHGWTRGPGETWTCPICSNPFAVDLPANAGRKSKKIIKLIARAAAEHQKAADKIAALQSKLETEIADITFEDAEKIQAGIDREEKRQAFAMAQAVTIRKNLIQSLIVDARKEQHNISRVMLTVSKQDQANEKEIIRTDSDRARLMMQAHKISTEYRGLRERNIYLQMLLRKFS